MSECHALHITTVMHVSATAPTARFSMAAGASVLMQPFDEPSRRLVGPTTAAHPRRPLPAVSNQHVRRAVADGCSHLLGCARIGCPFAISWRLFAVGSPRLQTSISSLPASSNDRGGWRLPTQLEWEARIARAVILGCTFSEPGTAPSLTNDAG